MPTIGMMHSGSKGNHDLQIKAFSDGLDWGGSSGANLTLVGPFYADDDPAKLDTIAARLVNTDKVNVLVAAGGSASSDAAKRATAGSGTPVVFTSVANPTRPATNMTGICARTSESDAARLNLLYELLPGQKNFGALMNASRSNHNAHKDSLNNAAALMGLPALDYKEIVSAGDSADTQIDRAFQSWSNSGCKGALVAADPLFNNRRERIIGAAGAPNNIPAIYQWREFAEDGGLMSYGPNLTVAYSLAGIYASRILGNTAPKDLPILSLNNFELVINLKTAKALGLNVPPTLLARADLIIA